MPVPQLSPIPRILSTRSWGQRAALGMAGLAWLAAAAHGQSSSPGCGPGVREIFDFHVGDVFQYRIYGQTLDGILHFEEVIRKYKVAARNESGFIRTYDITGLVSHSTIDKGVLVSKTYGSETKTVAYLDTAGSPFNGCAGAIVPMTSDPSLVTRVEELRGDTSAFPLAKPGLRMKAYGRVLGILRDTAIGPIADADQRETYAEGLGLVSAYYGGIGPYSRTALIGYVKDGDTVGVISPDSSFWHPNALTPPAARRAGPESRIGTAAQTSPVYDAAGRRRTATGTRVPAGAVMARYRK